MDVQNLLNKEDSTKAKSKSAQKGKTDSNFSEPCQRLDFLLETGRLPGYLGIINAKHEEQMLGQKALETWLDLAKELSLPEGNIVGCLDDCLYIQVGNHLMRFSLFGLWEDIGITEKNMSFLEKITRASAEEQDIIQTYINDVENPVGRGMLSAMNRFCGFMRRHLGVCLLAAVGVFLFSGLVVTGWFESFMRNAQWLP